VSNAWPPGPVIRWGRTGPDLAGLEQFKVNVARLEEHDLRIAEREWARDDGDGIRQVRVNTLEGLWTGMRNFLRPFRGVSKWFLAQYVAVFQFMVCPTLLVIA